MEMPVSTGSSSKTEIITGVQRARRWNPEQKLAWEKRTTEPGISVSLVAREAGISTSQLFQWRIAYLEGSLVEVAANEPVVPASELLDAQKRIKQLEAAIGRKTLENEILKETVGFAKAKKLDCAIASIARGRAVRAVCSALVVARSHMLERLNRPEDWQDRRKSPPRPDDGELLEAIKDVARDRASYGYRRVWAVLRLNGRQTNHKRIYWVMRNHRLLLHGRGEKPVSSRRHDGRIAVDVSNTRWCSDGFELSCDNGERVRVAFALDCCDREVMSWVATTKGIDADMDAPPQSNGMAESFVRTFKRGCANLAHRPDTLTVMRQLAGWFER
jgi:putative transposase